MMKKVYYLLTTLLISGGFSARAQSGFDQLIKSSPADATKLIDAYSEPLFKGIGYGMNSGWNNSAKTLGFLHFDIRLSATAAFVPSGDKSFDVTQVGLSNHIRPADPANTITPTFAGERSNNGPVMNIYDDNNNKVSSFTMPKGQIPVIPTPQLQLTIGLPKNTDIAVRYLPKYKISDDIGSIQMFGVGIKHDIMQDFGVAGKLIPFDLAVALGFNRVTYNKALNVQPESGAIPVFTNQSSDFSNQHIDGHFNSFMAQAIISKKLMFFTPFLAVGYNNAKTDVGLVGNYPITTTATFGSFSQKFYTTYNNPVNINEKSVNSMRADIGFQMNLAIVRIFASYSLAQYNSVNAGLGLGF